ncbi:MAG: type I-C CRISPR-associated protein Cas8c/Csd1 [Desulfobacteraceae bacterium 4572_187]|nr:MAG: type I-C CRISPR-associated protein Cas8c/Csd1 [Desulfobacteraceae bacterium 4572_187]
MILPALNNYYDRLRSSADADIPLLGFSSKGISFALLLNREGNLLQVLDLRETLGKRLLSKQMIVPEAVIKSVNIAANFMWDNTGYILGADNKGKPERSIKTFEAFKNLHHDIGEGLNDEGMAAVLRFLNSWNPANAPELEYWDEMVAGANLIFQLDGELRYVHDRQKVKDAWLKHYSENSSGVIATCLVCGEKKPIARLHPKIKGVRGAQTSGASIVSFTPDAFKSYGKEQSYNAPVSEGITFNYTTALNYLLRSGSRQKVQIGDAATVFWTERESPVEGFMGLVLNPQDDSGDLKEVRDFLEAARDGKKLPEEIDDTDMKFYILGLSPNASRLSVRFWHVSTVGDISAKIGWHFKDLSIIKNYDSEPEFPGIWQLLRETAVLRKSENISPVLSGSIIRSIMTGASYPQSLMTAIIGRIRADQEISYLRVAMIKACLVRKYRINQVPEEVTMALDKESTNVAYRFGRLFAVLEKAQIDAHKPSKINSTIKDRFFGSASATPRTVFPQLLRLAQYHIQKVKRMNEGRDWGAEKMIEEIMQDIQGFPAHLNLDDQGLFAIGYYHQRKDFFTKSDKKEDNDE